MKTPIIFMNRFALLVQPIVFLFIVSTGWAATRQVTCSGNITSALTSAISASADGDTINITAGTCNSNGVTITDKNLIINGAGQGVTNITANTIPIFDILRNSAAHANTQISSMSVSGTQSGGSMIKINGQYGNDGTNDGWRLDHLTLYFPNSGGYGIQVDGATYGLVDNCIITQLGGTGININGLYCSGGTCEVNQSGNIDTLQGRWLLSQPLNPGSKAAVYVENSTFTFVTDATSHAVFDTNNVGGRLVFRYNTVTNGIMYAHWTRNSWINGFWFEVYNNKFIHLASDQMYPGRFEGGTGLFYNNTITGFSDNYVLLNDPRGSQIQSTDPLGICNGTHNWDGNAGDATAAGWPCLGQIGRASGKSIAQIRAGDKQASFPFYSWNNGAQDKCSNPSASGDACTNSVNFSSGTANYVKGTAHTVAGGGYGQGDVDFCSNASQPAGCGTHTLTYTPLPYPYPLQALRSPSNVRIIQ